MTKDLYTNSFSAAYYCSVHCCYFIIKLSERKSIQGHTIKTQLPKEDPDSPSAYQSQFDALPQQVAEERQSMVQLHLFVVESQAKGH